MGRLAASSVLVATLLGAMGQAAADPPETLRSLPVDVPRSQLERLAQALELASALREKSVAQMIQEAVATSPDAQMLLLYLMSNTPKAIVADVVVTGGGGVTETAGSGELTATFGGRVEGDYCDLLHASVAVRVSYDAGVTGETRANAGLCLWQGLYVGPEALELEKLSASLFPLRMEGEIALNASPRFTSLRNQPRRRYTEAKYSFTLEGLRMMPSVPERGLTFIYAGFEQRWEWPDVFSGSRGFELAGGFGFFRVFRVRGAEALADRAIDIIDIELHGTRFDESVAIIDLYPVRIRGLGLGSSRVLLDAELGFGGSGGTIGATDCIDDVGCVEETIMTGANVASVNTWISRFGLAIGTRARGGGVHFVRRLDSNILGQVALENRTTGWFQTASGPVVARGEVFGGTATHYLDIDARGAERFAGASLDLQYQINARLVAGVQLDALRAFRRDPILEDRVAGSGVRAFATLSFTTELQRTAVALDLSALEPPPKQPEAEELAPEGDAAPDEPADLAPAEPAPVEPPPLDPSPDVAPTVR